MRHDAMAFCWRTQWAQFCFNALFCDSKIAICSLSLTSFFYVKDIKTNTVLWAQFSYFTVYKSLENCGYMCYLDGFHFIPFFNI